MLLTANTSVGTFTRNTNSDYKAIVVWSSPRAKECFEKAKQTGQMPKYGVDTKWVKDNGFAVTWHSSKQLAEKATKQYIWDSQAVLIGVFEI